jgi:hypothetical protein
MSDFYDTIGELRDALAALDVQDAQLFIDETQPTALSSYRGYYDQLAIERAIWGSATDNPGHDETKLEGKGKPFELGMAGYGTYSPGHGRLYIRREPTVSEFVKALNLAVGEEFEGYKGGQYTMHEDTDIWVSEYGDVDRRRILKKLDVSVERVQLTSLEVPW